MKASDKVEFGDFQTPLALAHEVCELIRRLGENPDVVVEPTAGRGAFLLAAAETFPSAELRGWEINQEYVTDAVSLLGAANLSARSSMACHDFFTCDWEAVLAAQDGRVLILGNPPWVTNSGVAAIDGTNLPAKENFMGLRGIAARTGKSNFDISEWMLIRLLRSLRGRPATLAMLCKTATARKFLRYAWQNDGRIAAAALYRIDAAKHFNAAVDACLLYLHTGSAGPQEADIYPALSATEPVSRIGLAGEELVADIRAYRALRHLEGLSPFRWRSGVKHDCAAIMELVRMADGGVENADGQRLDLEPDYLFPMLKCSDLANGRTIARRLVIVTQRFVGDDTAGIANAAPRTWAYLQTHRDRFNARKSSIYKGRVPFALFGIGEYAFAPWKVAVSGLHRSGRFQVVGPMNGQPVFFDDACYYLPFARAGDAQLVADILNSPLCQHFLASLVFTDSKRPFTVDLLQRLNLAAIAEEAGLGLRWQQLQRSSYAITADAPQIEFVMEEPERPA
ncbi:MAG: SAM-dependent DNA methyltransferase [Chthoniobacteraceae bacterium]